VKKPVAIGPELVEDPLSGTVSVEACEQLQYLVIGSLETHFVELMLEVRELSTVIPQQPLLNASVNSFSLA
jgi:hypothetical protein